jgi:hypothetical protein
VSEVGDAVIAAEATVSVTGMVCAGTFGDVLVSEIDPWYTPAARPVGLMVRFRLFGVEPVFGVTLSQVNPAGLVEAVAVKFSADPSVLVNEIVTGVLVVDPATAVTFTACRLAFSNGVLLAFSVTGMVNGVLVVPGTVTVIVPLQVVGPVMPLVFTATTSCPVCPGGTAVVPVAGVAERKPVQLVVLVATE